MKIVAVSQNSDRDLLIVSVFTFFTVTLWVFFEILKTVKTTTVSSTTAQIVIPLSPKLDESVFTVLAAKKEY